MSNLQSAWLDGFCPTRQVGRSNLFVGRTSCKKHGTSFEEVNTDPLSAAEQGILVVCQ